MANFVCFQQGRVEPIQKGPSTTKAGKTPGWVDMTGANLPGPTMLAIYRIDGDVLRIANGPLPVERPTGFDSTNTRVTVWTLKRAK
jgi:hypothetical protein